MSTFRNLRARTISQWICVLLFQIIPITSLRRGTVVADSKILFPFLTNNGGTSISRKSFRNAYNVSPQQSPGSIGFCHSPGGGIRSRSALHVDDLPRRIDARVRSATISARSAPVRVLRLSSVSADASQPPLPSIDGRTRAKAIAAAKAFTLTALAVIAWRRSSGLATLGAGFPIRRVLSRVPTLSLSAWSARIASEALARIVANPRFFATVPLAAGIFNGLTNKLAVTMMFRPISFQGARMTLPRPFRRRRSPSSPDAATLSLGWQGIVPREVRRMGSDISNLLVDDLLDLNEVLSRLDADVLAAALVDGTGGGGAFVGLCQRAVRNVLAASPIGGDDAPPQMLLPLIDRFVTPEVLRGVVARAVREVQSDVASYFDVRAAVVESMAARPRLLVDLFRRCGKDELAFMVTSGLWGGVLLGLGQMLAYAAYPAAWTLVLGGGLVGYVTDTAALKMMFAPIEPMAPFPGRLGKRLAFQGLFLRRQAEVSDDFGSFVSAEILPPAVLWEDLLQGPRRENLVDAIVTAILEEVLPSILRETMMSREWFQSFARNVADQIVTDIAADVDITAPTHDYVQERLNLRKTIRDAMASLPSAKFERVLHPVFEQDEGILIAVGSILGGCVGLAQTIIG